MASVLYYSRNPNPRLAVAVARYLHAPVIFQWAAPFDPTQSDIFRPMNPSLLLPILVEKGRSLWEADAIAARLAMMVQSDFWRMDASMPDMIRWISWGKANFVAAIDKVHFEFGTKQRYGFGPVDDCAVTEGEAQFHASARQLDAHLQGRSFLLDCGVSYADFRMASYLPFNDVAGLPLGQYRHLQAWYDRMMGLPYWADPFAGMDAPALPPVSPRRVN